VSKNDVPRLKRISGDRIEAFAESIDDLFMAYETLNEEETKEDDKVTLAVGVFYFEDRAVGKNYKW
jgi:hypothetical protein